MKNLLIVILAAAAVAAGVFYWQRRAKAGSGEVKFRTVKVERGEVVEGINASGTVQPFLLVQVGTQVSGVVEKLNKDFNDKVHAHEVIALIDSRRYVAQVAQDEAALGRSVADGARVRAQLEQAEKDLVRNKVLWERKLVSDSDLDAAVANAGSLRAQLEYTAAVVSLSQAQVEQDLINLNYCTIESPIDGVVVSRNVDVGQTVAASLQAPTLYVIANDLTKIQVQASVPEADIGRIQEKQLAIFTVDAHPEHVFEGRVSQVRLASTTVQNVVTYTVLIDAENPKGLLLPGMTANVTFEIAKSDKDALHVMTTALRYDPPVELVEPQAREAVAEKKEKPKKGDAQKKTRSAHFGKIYVKNAQGLLHPVPVKIGISDGAQAEVSTKDPAALAEGMEVVIGIQEEEEEASKNPFAPSMGGPRRGGH